jgi:hypothetical protein
VCGVGANKGVLLGTRLASEARNVIVKHPLEGEDLKDKPREANQGYFISKKKIGKGKCSATCNIDLDRQLAYSPINLWSTPSVAHPTFR